MCFKEAHDFSRREYHQWHLPEGAKARISRGAIRTMQYSPDGNLIAVVSSSGVWILDAQTAETLHLLAAHAGIINSISFSSDGRTLAVGTENGEAQLWDTSTGKHQKTFTRRDYFFGVDTVFIVPDGHTLAVVYASMVDLWDIATGQRKNTLTAVGNGTTNEDVNNTSNMYMSLGGYKNSFSSDGKTVASDSGEDTIRFWDIATRKEIRTLKAEPSGQYGELLSYSPDLQTVAIASHSYKGQRRTKIWEINLWDVNTQTQKKIFETDNIFGIPFLVFSPDGNFIASRSYVDKVIRIWDVNTGKEKKRLKGNKIVVSAVAFSPDNRTLVSAGSDETLRFWDVDTGKEKKTVTGYGGAFAKVLLSADGQTLASGSESLMREKTILLWDIETGSSKDFTDPDWTERQYKYEAKVASSLAFSPDGQALASGMKLGDILLWETATGAKKKTLRGHSESVSHISFSADGQTLISASYDGTILIWDLTPP